VDDIGAMLSMELILSKAKGPERRIGIGAAGDLDKVEASASIAKASKFGEIKVFTDVNEMVKELRNGQLDAAIRGSLDANLALKAIKREFSVDHISRMAILQPRNGHMFFFAPVGVDEGRTVAQKVEMATAGAALMRRIGVEPKVAILSGGRKGDEGRDPLVDKSMKDADEVVAHLSSTGIDAKNYQILIEEAAGDCNMIIAPDGISGNLIFRTLHFLGDGKALGAVVLNIDPIFVDTSRAKSSYLDSIALASALIETRK
jgi:putative methanogen marker protein 4